MFLDNSLYERETLILNICASTTVIGRSKPLAIGAVPVRLVSRIEVGKIIVIKAFDLQGVAA